MKEGLIKGIGLSEVSAANIRKAHAVHPITAIEMEWSLFSRDAEARPHQLQCPQKLSALCLLMSILHAAFGTNTPSLILLCHTIDHKRCSPELYKFVALPGCKSSVKGNNLCKLQHTCVCHSSESTKPMCLAFIHAVGLMTCHRNLQTVAVPAANWGGHQDVASKGV